MDFIWYCNGDTCNNRDWIWYCLFIQKIKGDVDMSIKRTTIREMTCNGETVCTDSVRIHDVSNAVLRRGAVNYGWHSNPKGDYDLCPVCSRKFLKKEEEMMACNGEGGCTKSLKVEDGERKRSAEKHGWYFNPKGNYGLCSECSNKFLKN